MNKWNFNILDEVIATAVNSMFADIKTKRKMQNLLFKAVIHSCYQYQNDSAFKSKIDAYANLYINE